MQVRVIHIAEDIDYLFPETYNTAKVLCGRLAADVLANGEFVGVQGNLNPDCAICPDCYDLDPLGKVVTEKEEKCT